MKKTALFLGILLMTCSLAACGSSAKAPKTDAGEVGEAEEAEVTEAPSTAQTEDADKDSARLDELTPDTYEDIIKAEVEETIRRITDKAEDVSGSIGESYAGYEGSREDLSKWYAFVLSESDPLYETIKGKTIDCYRLVADKTENDSDYDWGDVMDDMYDAWNDAMDDYYDAWNDLFDDLYDDWDDALDDDSIDYSTRSDTWSAAYEEHSSSWSAMYEAHSSAWSELYDNHSAVWSGFFSDETDVDKLIREAEEERAGKNEDSADSDSNEGTSGETDKAGGSGADAESAEGETPDGETAETDGTVFEPQDVSDATIESIRTYGDYLVMYRMITDDYLANYESAVKGTILYDEETFREMKEDMDEAFEEQEEEYGPIKDKKLVGKDDLVEFLKDYRDSLKETTDTYAEMVGMLP